MKIMKKTDVKKLTRVAFLSAIIILMTFTPLGYLTIGPISMTFLPIPVAVGAIVLGPASGAFLGLVFGITSFLSTFGEAFGEALLAINPFYVLILCIVPRVLEGYLCAVIYKLLAKKDKKGVWSVSAASIACPVLNTIFYMSALVLLFGRSDYITTLREGANIFAFVCAFVGFQAVVEFFVCGAVSSVVSVAVNKSFKSGK